MLTPVACSVRTQDRLDKLATILESEPWEGRNSSINLSTNEPTERTATIMVDSSFEDDISFESTFLSPSLEMGLDQDPISQASQQKTVSQCVICGCPFCEGEPVYQSNNPCCLHWHHQKCMDKWFQYQGNTCPTCNRPFVLEKK